MISATRPLLRATLFVGTLLFASSCGSDSEGTQAAEEVAQEGVPWDTRLDPVAEALEQGRPEEALELLAQHADDASFDPVSLVLLTSRARFLQGDAVAALRDIETARVDHVADARLWVMEAELYALMGRGAAAEDALRQGIKLAGRIQEIERAHGIIQLMRPGGARLGLESLKRAQRLEPALPFVDAPLSQAHLLVGRSRLGEAAGEARAHALAGLEILPGQPELRELLAESLESLGEFDAALEVMAELEADGLDFGDRRALLHQKAATASLIAGEREAALDHYRLARELGLDETGLGFGATALEDAAEEAVDRGFVRLEAEDYEAAEIAFARALSFDPTSPEARYFLGVARFRRERFVEAALVWDELLRLAEAEGLQLPDPVHLNVARAWRMAGEVDEARSVLDDYLTRSPDGIWAEDTREMRARLDG